MECAVVALGSDASSCGAEGATFQNIMVKELMHDRSAVMDKNLTSAKIACDAGADTLITLTDIEAIYTDHKTKSVRPLKNTSSSELKMLLDQGQFPSGSSSPKVMAAIQCMDGCRKKAVIAKVANLYMALQGQKGTTVVRER